MIGGGPRRHPNAYYVKTFLSTSNSVPFPFCLSLALSTVTNRSACPLAPLAVLIHLIHLPVVALIGVFNYIMSCMGMIMFKHRLVVGEYTAATSYYFLLLPITSYYFLLLLASPARV